MMLTGKCEQNRCIDVKAKLWAKLFGLNSLSFSNDALRSHEVLQDSTANRAEISDFALALPDHTTDISV
jgi:hypothetical protein